MKQPKAKRAFKKLGAVTLSILMLLMFSMPGSLNALANEADGVYSVTYVANDSVEDPALPMPDNAADIAAGATYVVPAVVPLRTGYTFTAWLGDDGGTYAADGSASIENMAANLVLTAQWAEKAAAEEVPETPETPACTCGAECDGAACQCAFCQEAIAGGTACVDNAGCSCAPAAPGEDGQAFGTTATECECDALCNGTDCQCEFCLEAIAGGTACADNANCPCAPVAISVVFNLNGGNVGGDESDITLPLFSGDTLAAAAGVPAPVKENFVFGGWEKDGAAWAMGAKLTEDMTLTAVWLARDARVTSEAELNAAIAAAPAGQTADDAPYVIELANDITTTASITIPAGKHILLAGGFSLIANHVNETIVVNGALTLDGITVTHAEGQAGGSSRGVTVNVTGTVVMNGGAITGNGVYNSKTEPDLYGGGVYSAGTFIMRNNAAIVGNVEMFNVSVYNRALKSYGVGVYNDGGSFTMEGGKISKNEVVRSVGVAAPDSHGVGLYNNGGTITMDGGEITDNTSSSSSSRGGGVHNEGGTFIMNSGAVISRNLANLGGGVFSNGTFDMNGGTISDNKHCEDEATDCHDPGTGGVCIFGTGTFTMRGGVISGNSGYGNHAGGVQCIGSGTFIMWSGKIVDNGHYGVSLNSGSDGTMNGGEISGNTSGGVILGGSTFTMNNGTISNNYGSGVHNATSAFTMNGGVISGNTAGSGGGLHSMITAVSNTMNGGIISGNTSTGTNETYHGGGGVYGNLTMRGGTITGNTAARNGGGVFGATLTMSGGTISDNTAQDGGGFSGKLIMTGGTISGNTATRDGGGVNGFSGNAIEGEISGNTAGRNGGGICTTVGSGFNVASGGVISGNTAASYGGGIYFLAGYVTVEGTISGNTAEMGGGIYLNPADLNGTLTLKGAVITDNTATKTSGATGGGVYILDTYLGNRIIAHLKVDADCTFSGNTAWSACGRQILYVGDYRDNVFCTRWSTDRGILYGEGYNNFDIAMMGPAGAELYKVTFDLNGGNATPAIPYQLHKANELVTQPATIPTSTEGTFLGWYTKDGTGDDWGSKWDFASDVMPASNLTLYAKYGEAPPVTHTVTLKFTDRGASGAFKTETLNNVSGAFAPDVTAGIYDVTNKVPVGWYVGTARPADAGFSALPLTTSISGDTTIWILYGQDKGGNGTDPGPGVTPNPDPGVPGGEDGPDGKEDITLKLYWVDANGDDLFTGGRDFYVNLGENFTRPGKTPLTVGGKTYTLQGYKIGASKNAGTLESAAPDYGPVTLADAGKCVTYVYAENTYTATINLNKDDTAWDGKTVELYNGGTSAGTLTDNGDGSYTGDLPNGTYAIYVDGVDTGKTVVINNAANSETLNYYTLTLTAGTGITSVTGGGVHLEGAAVAIDATVTGGYGWSKWVANPASFGDESTKAASITMPGYALGLTATATMNGYTLTYNINGGDAASLPAVNPVSGLSGSATLAADVPTHADEAGVDVVFWGWSKAPITAIQGASAVWPAGTTRYLPGGSITMDASYTLYAVWAYDTDGNGIPDPMDIPSVTKDSAAASYTPGGTLAYTITFDLPADLSMIDQVRVEDAFDSQLTFSGLIGATIGGADVSGDITVDTGALASGLVSFVFADTDLAGHEGETVELELEFTVGGSATGSIANTVNIYTTPVGGTEPVNPGPTDEKEIDADTYTLTYNANFPGGTGTGTAPTDQNGPYATGAAVPVLGAGTMSKDGWAFLGWAESNTATAPLYTVDGSNIAPASFTMGTGNAVLYGVWEQVPTIPSVTKNAASATYVPGGTMEYTITFTLPANLSAIQQVRIEDKFPSSLSNPSLVSATIGGNSVRPAVKTETGKASFTYTAADLAGHEGETVELVVKFTISATASNAITNNVNIYTTPKNGREPTVPGTTGDETITPKSYTVSFDANGGSMPAGQTKMVVTEPAKNVGTLPSEPARAGYDFIGWNTKADGTGSPFTANTVLTGDITVYAQWQPKVPPSAQATVTFNANGGSGVTPGSLTVDKGTPVGTLPTSPTRTGYTFQGWNTSQDGSGSAFTAASTVNGNMTVYAQWKANTTTYYTLYFNLNGGDGAPPASQSLPTNTLASAVANPTRAGYTFLGWNTAASGNGTSWSFGSSKMPAHDVTLYAQWQANGRVPVAPSAANSATSTPESRSAGSFVATPPSAIIVSGSQAEMASSEISTISMGGGNVPTGSFGSADTWSLLNLICATVGILASLILLVGAFTQNRRRNNNQPGARVARSSMVLRVASILIGVLTLLLFFILENLSSPMSFINTWTLVIVPLFLIQMVAVIIFNTTKHKEENDENDMYETA